MRSKILLAMPTPLYAPLYLAKHLTLSKEFAHIDFEYPREYQIDGRDELIDKLLNKIDATDALLAVVDPMRILFAKRDPLTHYQPLVLKCLIDKMCYWKIGYYPENNTQLLKDRAKIITHPKWMTGHIITKHDLLTFQDNKSESEKKEIISAIDENIFYEINAGDENRWYQDRYLSLNLFQVGVVTADPLIAYKSFNEEQLSIKCFSRQQEYQDIIMTALITSKEIYQNEPQSKEIIDDLIKGIQLGIRFINEDPLTASQKLLEYTDNMFRPEAMGWNELYMFKFFKEILKGENIYSDNLQVKKSARDKSKSIWEKVIESEADVSIRNEKKEALDANVIDDHFDFGTSYYFIPFYQQSFFSRFRDLNKKNIKIKITGSKWLKWSYWLGTIIGSIWIMELLLKITSFLFTHDPIAFEKFLIESFGPFSILFGALENHTYEEWAALIVFILFFRHILHIILEIRTLTPSKSIFATMFFSWASFVIITKLCFVHITDPFNHMNVEIFSAVFTGLLLPLVSYNRNLKLKLSFWKYVKRKRKTYTAYCAWRWYNIGRIVGVAFARLQHKMGLN